MPSFEAVITRPELTSKQKTISVVGQKYWVTLD